MKSHLLIGCAAVLLFAASRVHAQDTLASGMACYTAIIDDWKDQDTIGTKTYRAAINTIVPTLSETDRALIRRRLTSFSDKADNSAEMIALYVRACSARRATRLASYIERFRKVIFSQHERRGGQYFFREVERQGGFAGKGLELLEMNGYYGSVTHLLPSGEARDPDVSFDGKRVLFAWRGGTSGGKNYRIFEMDLATKKTRQITKTSASAAGYQWGCQDIEPCYLPNDNIMFVSSRHIQEIDCIPGPAVNLFLCDKDGKYTRRIGFDQVPTNYPRVLPSGEVIYCRWDYNDKSHTYAHPLFVMNPDGTAQREYYGNNSWWPTNILQERPIPGSNKVMVMLGGYHTAQEGKIAIIDNNVGMQNGKGITLLAPIRTPAENTLEEWGPIPSKTTYPWTFDDTQLPTKTARPVDRWGQNPPLFAYPCPLDEKAFLVSCRPAYRVAAGDTSRYGLYFFTADNQRELLFADQSCAAPVVVTPRALPPVPSSPVNYAKSTGIYQVMNVYTSQPPVMDGVAPGSIKRLRVCGLEYRPGPVRGISRHWGEGNLNFVGASFNNPIATGNASWDVKRIIGETPVYADGSASFIVPARTPFFFQLLDAKGEVVQTMRSWSTLQPGETFACMGCHESKLAPPPPLTYVPEAIRQGPKELEPFYGPARGFSFAAEIQPILTAKCISCHDGTKAKLDLRGVAELDKRKMAEEGSLKRWLRSYKNLVKHDSGASESEYVNWHHAESVPILQPPYRNGSCKSPLVDTLEAGHQNVSMTKEEMDKIKCWIDIGVPSFGSYTEGFGSFDRGRVNKNLGYRAKWEAEERANIKAYIAAYPVAVRDEFTVRGKGVIENRSGLMVRQTGAGAVTISLSYADQTGLAVVSMQIFDAQGSLVRELVQGKLTSGNHSFTVSGLSSGRYFVRMKTLTQEKVVPFISIR